MNVNDGEILLAVMKDAGYIRTKTIEESDIVFIVTVFIIYVNFSSVLLEIRQKLKYGTD